MAVIINGRKRKNASVYKYLCYLLDKISLESNDSLYDKVCLKNSTLLMQYKISPYKQYYTGFMQFLRYNKIIECTDDNYKIGIESRKYSINFQKIYDVVKQFLEQKSSCHSFYKKTFLVRFMHKCNVPEYFKRLTNVLYNSENPLDIIETESIEYNNLFRERSTCSCISNI